MEILGKLESNDTSIIGKIPSASRYVYIKIPEQFLHMITYNEQLNVLKGITKMQKRE